MKPLLVIAAMLQLFMISDAQSGGGDVEDDASPRGCVVRKGNNTAFQLNRETNLTSAVLRARCYSVCLQQVFALSSYHSNSINFDFIIDTFLISGSLGQLQTDADAGTSRHNE